MNSILLWIGEYVTYFPMVIFLGLMLGGFNIPVSEDALIIMSALLCQQEKASIPTFLCALYFGAVLSDYLVYFWGKLLGKGLINFGVFKKIVTEENTKRISRALEHHGFLTYLFGRFIPFGIRNVLSMTSGFVQFPFYKFAVFDSIAALFSISSLFWLTYFFGSSGSIFIKILGVIVLIGVTGFCIYLVKSGKIIQITDKKLDKEDQKNTKAFF